MLPDGTYKIADLPDNISGRYGNKIKCFIIYESYVNNTSQAKIKQTLTDIGIDISEGEIHNIIMEVYRLLEQEYSNMARAGMTTAKELRVDDTGARHRGTNGYCLVVQNDLFTCFVTGLTKSRMQLLTVLRGDNTDYVLNDTAIDYLRAYEHTKVLMSALLRLKDHHYPDKAAWEQALISVGINPNKVSATMLLHIEEAGFLGSAIEHGISPQLIVQSDGALQYRILVHSLCWIHAERAIKKIVPINKENAAEIHAILDDIWKLYARLKEYKNDPNKDDKASIESSFDTIFSRTVVSENLAAVLRNFRLKKQELLRVLEYPFIALHNNSSEQDIRAMVIKKNISGQTRSDEGRRARDVFVSLVKTCKKHRISPWDYFTDRLNKGSKVPNMSDIIRQKARSNSPP